MLLSMLLTFTSLDPSLQAQANTHVTQTASKLLVSSRPNIVGSLESIREAMNALVSIEGLDEEAKHKMLESMRKFDENLRKLKELRKTPCKVDSSYTGTGTPTSRMQEQFGLLTVQTKLLEENTRKLQAQLLESERLLEASQKKAP
jgi:hypothetical protein